MGRIEGMLEEMGKVEAAMMRRGRGLVEGQNEYFVDQAFLAQATASLDAWYEANKSEMFLLSDSLGLPADTVQELYNLGVMPAEAVLRALAAISIDDEVMQGSKFGSELNRVQLTHPDTPLTSEEVMQAYNSVRQS